MKISSFKVFLTQKISWEVLFDSFLVKNYSKGIEKYSYCSVTVSTLSSNEKDTGSFLVYAHNLNVKFSPNRGI